MAIWWLQCVPAAAQGDGPGQPCAPQFAEGMCSMAWGGASAAPNASAVALAAARATAQGSKKRGAARFACWIGVLSVIRCLGNKCWTTQTPFCDVTDVLPVIYSNVPGSSLRSTRSQSHPSHYTGTNGPAFRPALYACQRLCKVLICTARALSTANHVGGAATYTSEGVQPSAALVAMPVPRMVMQ